MYVHVYAHVCMNEPLYVIETYCGNFCGITVTADVSGEIFLIVDRASLWS